MAHIQNRNVEAFAKFWYANLISFDYTPKSQTWQGLLLWLTYVVSMATLIKCPKIASPDVILWLTGLKATTN